MAKERFVEVYNQGIVNVMSRMKIYMVGLGRGLKKQDVGQGNNLSL